MHANLCLRPTAEHLPPLVSVVVPCFNGRRFLREAIESALAQCFTPVEVIVVDDGSTDGSREVAECFPSVLIISQSNQGVSVARNAGLHACHGTYVVFLDADDRLHPNAIASHVAAFADNPDNVMVFGGNRLIDEAGTVIGENDQPAFTFHVAEVLLGVVPSPSQSMFRREVLVAAGGFNPFLSHGEDFDLYARLTACGTGRSHGVIVADYRLHSGQATKQPATGLKMVLSIIESRRVAGQDGGVGQHARIHWERYFGQFIPMEIARLLRRGQLLDAVSAARTYLRYAPHTVLGSISYFALRIRQSIVTAGGSVKQRFERDGSG